jgi:hypothetical protein
MKCCCLGAVIDDLWQADNPDGEGVPWKTPLKVGEFSNPNLSGFYEHLAFPFLMIQKKWLLLPWKLILSDMVRG